MHKEHEAQGACEDPPRFGVDSLSKLPFLSQGVIREQETNAKLQEEGQVKQMSLSWT